MNRLKLLTTRLLIRALQALEPNMLILPPSPVDYAVRNFGRPEAQTAGYLGGNDIPEPHEHFGHIRLWNVRELAKDSQDYVLPDIVEQTVGSNNDILDAACGLGNDGERMIKLGNRVWGLDVIPICVEKAAQRGLR